MKRPFKAREVAFILLPVVGLSAFAWYQKRVETVGAPRRSNGISVTSVELKTAKGRFRAMGLSHQMKVTIGHSRPLPAWWNNWNVQSGIDPLQSHSKQGTMPGMPAQKMISYGAALTTTSMRNGKPVLKTQWRDTRIGAPVVDNRLVFSHKMALDKIPASAGEVTFRAVYLIGAQKPLRVTRVVRKASEIAPTNRDRSPQARIVSTKTEAFSPSMNASRSTTDTCRVNLVMVRTIPGQKKPELAYDDLKLRDADGKVLKPYVTGFTFGVGDGPDTNNINEGQRVLFVNLSKKLKTKNPLTFSGKISVDNGWPIPFSIRLPKR